MSETTAPAVYRAISDVQAALASVGIAKSRTNPQQGWKFRGVDDLHNALGPLLPKHGLLIFPRVLKREMTQRETSKGAAIFSVVLDVEFDFTSNVDGSIRVVGPVPGEAMDTGDKAHGKALSYAYKSACLMVFSVPIEGDNDPDATAHEIAPAKQKPAKKPSGQKPSTDTSDRLHKASEKFDAALDAAGSTKHSTEEVLGYRGECAGILSFAASPKGLPAGPLRILQKHAAASIIDRLGRNAEAPELGRELHGLGLLTDEDWCDIQAAMDSDIPQAAGATT